jgi:hypothetical protein
MLTSTQIRRILEFERHYGGREGACFGSLDRYPPGGSSSAPWPAYKGDDKPLPITVRKYKGKTIVATR